ncbi:MAG: hypothetical protein PVG11_09370, partial [Anaerolineae bacterium]|jgi:hypothetical protein
VLFGVISAAAMAGAITWLARWRGSPSATAWRRWAIVLLGAVWLLSWGSSLLRVHPVFVAHSHLYWPVARYVAVSIVPTAVALCGGLSVLVPARWQAAAAYAGLLALLFVDLVARWLVIIPYYYG